MQSLLFWIPNLLWIQINSCKGNHNALSQKSPSLYFTELQHTKKHSQYKIQIIHRILKHLSEASQTVTWGLLRTKTNRQNRSSNSLLQCWYLQIHMLGLPKSLYAPNWKTMLIRYKEHICIIRLNGDDANLQNTHIAHTDGQSVGNTILFPKTGNL